MADIHDNLGIRKRLACGVSPGVLGRTLAALLTFRTFLLLPLNLERV